LKSADTILDIESEVTTSLARKGPPPGPVPPAQRATQAATTEQPGNKPGGAPAQGPGKMKPARARYEQLKEVIKNGKETFIEVGMALAEIKQGHLYLHEYGTWAEFCKVEYGFTPQHANRLASAAKAVKSLEENKKSESPGSLSLNAMRALQAVPTEKREQVLQAVVASGKRVTAKNIKEASSLPTGKFLTKDGTGLLIPEVLLPSWERELTTVERYQYVLERLRMSLVEHPAIFLHEQAARIAGLFKELEDAIGKTEPFAVCPILHGELAETPCTLCKGVGYVSRDCWHGPRTPDIRRMLRVKAVEKQNSKQTIT
jgi:hypothetical protein